MLSIARRPSANATKSSQHIRQEHEQDDLLHLANRTQLRRVTLTSPAISTPTLANTGTSGSLTPPGPPSVMTADASANGLMWNTMSELGERHDRGDVEMPQNDVSPSTHVSAAFNNSTDTSISPADAFRAGPSRLDEGHGSREAQQRRAFRALPRSRNLRAGTQDAVPRSEQHAHGYQQAGNSRDAHRTSTAMHPDFSDIGLPSSAATSSRDTHEHRRSNVINRLSLGASAETRGRSLGVLPFEHMNAYGMPFVMDPSNLNMSRNQSQSNHHNFPSTESPVDHQAMARSSHMAQGMPAHHREFPYSTGQTRQSADMMSSGSRQTDTLLFQHATPHSNTAYNAHTAGERSSARGFAGLADPHLTYRDNSDFAASALDMDMDVRTLREMGDISSLSGIHSLDTIDMEMGGMDMDNMPLLPAGGSLHDVEQFIAGWHDQ